MKLRTVKDRFGFLLSRYLSAFSVFLIIVLFAGLVFKSAPILEKHSLSNLLFSSEWKPMKDQFGFLPFILSTIYVTLIALTIAVPLSILTSVYLVEFAPKKYLKLTLPLIDMLAGIPSVIFGIWGVIIIVPFIREYLGPAFGYETSGYCILSGGIVLAIMVFPIMIHMMMEILKTVPKELHEATLSLGANKWETIKFVVLRKALPGIVATVILGFSRAFGETIAVLMVAGNVVKSPTSVFDAGYPLPALIANNYGEMLSIPMYDSALMFAALILFIIIFGFNVLSGIILKKLQLRIL